MKKTVKYFSSTEVPNVSSGRRMRSKSVSLKFFISGGRHQKIFLGHTK